MVLAVVLGVAGEVLDALREQADADGHRARVVLE